MKGDTFLYINIRYLGSSALPLEAQMKMSPLMTLVVTFSGQSQIGQAEWVNHKARTFSNVSLAKWCRIHKSGRFQKYCCPHSGK